jgi:putative pyruvate formate lyase activating enzyme
MSEYVPGYKNLLDTGELEIRVRILNEKLNKCTLCPHQCRAYRNQGEKGICNAGSSTVISSYGPHYGEEDVLVGRYGSGTIFFSWCNLRCVFCQNFRISHYGEGYETKTQELAEIMLSLQRMGCHNINLVSPTIYVPQIVEAVFIAAKRGLGIPLVYNTGGYDSMETLKLLDGIIDIYMPDLKFFDNDEAYKYTKASEYLIVASKAVKEMFRQVGTLKTDERNIAYKGLMIRHLVMPGNLENTKRILSFIANEISNDTYVNIMPQYYPAHMAFNYTELSQRLSTSEYTAAINHAKKLGLSNFL